MYRVIFGAAILEKNTGIRIFDFLLSRNVAKLAIETCCNSLGYRKSSSIIVEVNEQARFKMRLGGDEGLHQMRRGTSLLKHNQVMPTYFVYHSIQPLHGGAVRGIWISKLPNLITILGIIHHHRGIFSPLIGLLITGAEFRHSVLSSYDSDIADIRNYMSSYIDSPYYIRGMQYLYHSISDFTFLLANQEERRASLQPTCGASKGHVSVIHHSYPANPLTSIVLHTVTPYGALLYTREPTYGCSSYSPTL